MKIFQSLKLGLLFLTVFTLPMYMRINNLFLGAFIAVGVLDNILNRRYIDHRGALIQGAPIIAFFLLALIGSFRSLSLEGFSYLEKYWSFLLLPITLLPDRSTFSRRHRSVFIALVWGCVTTLLICYANVLWEMVTNAEPISYFFRWRHLGHQFTEIADTHPTYLAVFIVTAVCFLAQDKYISNTIKSTAIPFLILSLFQLASRIALVIFLMLLLFILFQRFKQKKWQLAALIFGLIFAGLLTTFYGSNYLKNRILTTESVTNDRRVARWEVSYEIFRENPVVGVGYKKIKPLRREGYLNHGFDLAASEDYNAHNQFLEYLSTQGVIGGFVYGISLSYLLFLALYRKDLLFSFVFFALIIANLTESMLVRIKGIEYLAIFGTVFLCGVYSNGLRDEDIEGIT